jgi:hypothetical protein
MPKKSHWKQVEEINLVNWYKWEFLRRNPEYRKDYEEFMGRFGNWFEEHGYWYDQTTTDPWGSDNFRFFASVIAPIAKAICERWEITDPYPPDWEFTKRGVYYYKPDFEVFLPTDCPKESAGKFWDFSDLSLSIDELEKKLAEYTASQHGRPPDFQLQMTVDLRRPLKVLLYEATELLKDRKRRYDRKYPLTKITQTVRRRLDLYDTYLKVWDFRTQDSLKLEAIGAQLFPDEPRRAQRALDSFKRAQELIDGGYKELR